MKRLQITGLAVAGLVLLAGFASLRVGSHAPNSASAHSLAPGSTQAARSGSRVSPSVSHSVSPSRAASSARVTVPPSPLRILSTTYPTPSLGGRRRVMVLLPEHYATSGVSYPVVELLHGHPGDPIDIFSGKKAAVQTYATARGIAPFIAVVPDGNGPVVGDSWWADIKSQHMATAVTRDLRSWASATFRTNGSWTYAGLSSGGYAAGYLPTVDTQPVHAECGLSGFYDASRPPIPAGSSLATRQRYSPIAQARRAPALVFLAYGNRDTATERQTLGYVAALHAVHHRVIVRVYPGGHEWKVWRAGFEECLRLAVPG